MRILVCIPVVKNVHVLDECLKQVLGKENVDVMILLNGADADVVEYCEKYDFVDGIIIAHNKTNEYVTAAWNYFMWKFLNLRHWDRLIIMNSDLTLCDDWDVKVRSMWSIEPNYVIVPVVVDDKNLVYNSTSSSCQIKDTPNPPGIFITLTRSQVEQVYPIPEEIKIWFNDNWIYAILNAYGNRIITPDYLLAFHHTSTHVKNQWALDIIEEDKKAWVTLQKTLEQKCYAIRSGYH